MEQEERLTEHDCWVIFQQLFPGGLQDSALVGALAPEGWERSALVYVFHPTSAQLKEEARQMKERLGQIRHVLTKEAIPQSGPDIEEPQQDERILPVDPITECATIVAECLWDIFSDNHQVTTANGKAVHLGTFRAAADFIGAFHDNPETVQEDLSSFWGGSRFYLGSIWSWRRADLFPVYELLFRRMHRLGLDWQYVHPRLFLVPLSDRARDDNGLQSAVTEANYKSVREAQQGEPPTIVQAYAAVYGTWPKGWPPRMGEIL